MSPWDVSRGRGRDSLGELHPGDGTIVMAYLEVVGGMWEPSIRMLENRRRRCPKITNENSKQESERNAKTCAKQRRPDKRDWRAAKLVLSQVGHSQQRNES